MAIFSIKFALALFPIEKECKITILIINGKYLCSVKKLCQGLVIPMR